MITIAKSGGDFATVTDALRAHRESQEPLLLLLRMDTYEENVVIDRAHVRLRGEAMNRTILSGTQPLTIAADDVSVENLTLRIRQGDDSTFVAYGEATDGCMPTCYVCCDESLSALPEDVTRGAVVEWLREEGASSKSYASGERLGCVEVCLRRGDRLVIALGLHDADEDVRHATHCRLTYPLYLQMFVDASLRHGAEPVLVVTPGVPQPYAEAAADLAAQRRVRLVRQDGRTERHANTEPTGGVLYDPLRR